MTEIMLRTSAEKSTKGHKTLHPQAMNKTKTLFFHVNFLPRLFMVKIHTNKTDVQTI